MPEKTTIAQTVDLLEALHDAGHKMPPESMNKLALILSEQVKDHCEDAIPHDDSRALISYLDFMSQLPGNVENCLLEYEAIGEIVRERKPMFDITRSKFSQSGFRIVEKNHD